MQFAQGMYTSATNLEQGWSRNLPHIQVYGWQLQLNDLKEIEAHENGDDADCNWQATSYLPICLPEQGRPYTEESQCGRKPKCKCCSPVVRLKQQSVQSLPICEWQRQLEGARLSPADEWVPLQVTP